jgi:repressor LexA
MNGLTSRQRAVLDFVSRWISIKGYSPSYQEIGDALDISRVAAHRLVHSLAERGAITLMPQRARSIAIRKDAIQ